MCRWLFKLMFQWENEHWEILLISLLCFFDLCFIITNCELIFSGISFSAVDSWAMWTVTFGLQTHIWYKLGVYQGWSPLRSWLNAVIFSLKVPSWAHSRPHSLVPAWNFIKLTPELILKFDNCPQASYRGSSNASGSGFQFLFYF